MKELKTLLLMLITVILMACSSQSEATPTVAPAPPTAAETPTSQASQATTSPLAAPESPLAAPESPLATPASAVIVEPNTTATTGAVIGTVRIRSATVDKPVADMKVALAEVIQPEAGPPRATGYDPANSPQTTSDSQGHFVIENVKPGLYGIILDGVITSLMLVDPETQESIIIEVKANEFVDVGTLEYESLALPGYMGN
jgi:hypothetical protein